MMDLMEIRGSFPLKELMTNKVATKRNKKECRWERVGEDAALNNLMSVMIKTSSERTFRMLRLLQLQPAHLSTLFMWADILDKFR